MGRIAEALKKAQQERSEKIRLGLTDGAEEPVSSGTVSAALMASRSATETQSQAPRFSDLPLVGEVPGDGGAALRGLDPGSRLVGPSLDSVAPPPWDTSPTLIALRDRTSSITEQYRAVRTWLLRRNSVGERSCIAITSSVPREGKSVTTANLAVVMSEIRHMNVLAVDADLRQGHLASMFKLPNSPGLADVLAGRATLREAIVKTPLGNLSFLPAGASQELNPTGLLNSTVAASVFEEIRERYHYVLVDTPPVQWLSDIGVIGALCSSILMVVRMNKTPSNLVKQSVNWIRSNNLNVIGCIAAACSLNASRYGYREPNVDT